jgi:cyclic pyranopterin phosphate synthase
MLTQAQAPASEELTDACGRAITYLRVSVTDRCNLRCVYCMPEEGIPLRPHVEILRYEEIERLVRVAVGLGVVHVRLTGGEPLVRAGIADLVRLLSAIPSLEELSMTTNGTRLAELAAPLAQAGLRRVNVSLDTLRPERYHTMTRCGNLADVLRGIEAARHVGLNPVKLNMVVVRGTNDDEVVDLARRTLDEGWNVRYIEVMPLGESAAAGEEYIPSHEIRRRIEAALGPLEPAELPGSGPARYWRLKGAPGAIGFISPLSEHFCAGCNRLRLTADGRLMPCLFSDLELDLRTPLRGGADDATLRALFLQALEIKPRGHRLAERQIPRGRCMSRVGG